MTRRIFLTTTAAAAANRSEYPAQYPLYRAQGSHLEWRQHGEQAAAKIKAHLDYIGSSGKMSREQIRSRALRFKPLFEKQCPHLLEEMRGLAEGAGIRVEDALAVNIRGELGHAAEEGCTAYAVKQREILIGQNSDITADIPPFGYVLHLKPSGKPEVMIWTYGGMIGYHGINSAGVGHFANALGGGPPGRFAMPHYPVKRMMLECESLGEVVDLLRKFRWRPTATMFFATPGHSRCRSDYCRPRSTEERRKGFLAHTNHYVCARYARERKFRSKLAGFLSASGSYEFSAGRKRGSITVDDLKKYLSDHDGHPTSICRHDRESCTVASIIAEPGRRQMHVAVGNPCQNGYVTYSM